MLLKKRLKKRTEDQIWNSAIATAIVMLPFKDKLNRERLRRLYRRKLKNSN